MTGHDPLLELWQAEWCPSCRRVRQRFTELGVSFIARQVPAAREQRAELEAMSGQSAIPVLVAGEQVYCGEEAIFAFLERSCEESPEAILHQQMASRAKRKELEQACRERETHTH